MKFIKILLIFLSLTIDYASANAVIKNLFYCSSNKCGSSQNYSNTISQCFTKNGKLSTYIITKINPKCATAYLKNVCTKENFRDANKNCEAIQEALSSAKNKPIKHQDRGLEATLDKWTSLKKQIIDIN